jgi:hypothetical protein
MRLVLVEWLDSYGCSSTWQPLAHVNPAAMICKSVGWLLHEDDRYKVIVPHISDETEGNTIPQQGCGDMTIPVAAIVSLRDLVVT